MVSQNINDRLVRKLAARPSATFPAQMNVASQHDDVGAGRRDFGCLPKFQVQVRQNVQAHK